MYGAIWAAFSPWNITIKIDTDPQKFLQKNGQCWATPRAGESEPRPTSGSTSGTTSGPPSRPTSAPTRAPTTGPTTADFPVFNPSRTHTKAPTRRPTNVSTEVPTKVSGEVVEVHLSCLLPKQDSLSKAESTTITRFLPLPAKSRSFIRNARLFIILFVRNFWRVLFAILAECSQFYLGCF